MKYRPMLGGMLNTAWISACERAGLAGLHVHDLRHTVGLRLREAAVPENTISDILWHQRTGSTMTAHYSQAQVVELRDALERIREDTGQFNKSLRTLLQEAKAARLLRVVGGTDVQNKNGVKSPHKVPTAPRGSDARNGAADGQSRAISRKSPPKVPTQRKRA